MCHLIVIALWTLETFCLENFVETGCDNTQMTASQGTQFKILAIFFT
jgi:uncharacterized membrane protein YwzB